MTNILFDGAIIAKVQLFFLSCKEIYYRLIILGGAGIYGNNLKQIFSRTKQPMTLKGGMRHRVLKYYQVCSNDDTGLTMTYFTARSDLVPYAFV